MIVYPSEVNDGIADLVKASTSIAYHTEAKPLNILGEKEKNKIQFSLAAKDQPDLYYLDTILVTTGWNLNRDIFDKKETWAARHTAEDKPFNLNHVEDDIIGHMTSNFVVDDEYKLIADNSSLPDVPDKFHILTGAVIYKFKQDETRRNAIAKIIEEIAEGKWFVSMEALFTDFDYGLKSATGECKVIARNEESSFLTKHLVQYKGTGKYQDYSIGRVLKNITFSGKGLVATPANPESKILTNVTTFKSLGYINSSVFANKNGDKIMSDENKAVETLKAELAEQKKVVADLNKQLSDTNTKAVSEKITDLENKLTAAEKKAKEDKDKYDEKTKEMASQLKDLAEAKDKAEKDKKDAEDKMCASEAKVKVIERESLAVKAGAKDEAKAFAEKYTSLPDDAYADMLSYASHKWNAGESAKTETETPASAAAKVVESASTPTTEVVIAAEGESESTMAQIKQYMLGQLNQNRNKKAEK